MLTTAKKEGRKLAPESNGSSRWSFKFLDTYYWIRNADILDQSADRKG